MAATGLPWAEFQAWDLGLGCEEAWTPNELNLIATGVVPK